jgi:hypothetical protein
MSALAAAGLVAAGLATSGGCGLLSGVDSFHVASSVSDGAVADAPGSSGDASAQSGSDSATPESDSPGGGHVDAGPDANNCPAGLTCNVSCPGGTTTTISGTVYDPARSNPLYGVVVYVPATPLQPLPTGLLPGADACECGALYTSGAIVSTTTAADGTFTLTNVPVGGSVPLVIQAGKWRKSTRVPVRACRDNHQADKSLAFSTTIPAGDTDDNIPDIAVSTGAADTLECVLLRMGLAASEYVAGAATGGHVHIFAGGSADAGMNPIGGPETPPFPGAPASATSLWSTSSQLTPYDLVLLSCEGGDTYDANPQALEAYVNAGGRVFASHFHFTWFSGPIDSMQSYTAPADWSNLATWMDEETSPAGPVGGIIATSLNAGGAPFAKGVALQTWLGVVGALGTAGVPSAELAIYTPRFNANVGPSNTPSQPWIIADPEAGAGASPTMTFSFDTPVTSTPPPANENPYCGRVVFSDLHADGNPSTVDSPPAPGGCDATPLSPQERAIEFLLFDLASCVIPDSTAPPDGGALP